MEAIFIHKEWNDICIIDYNYIKRKNIQNETGFLTKINDEIITNKAPLIGYTKLKIKDIYFTLTTDKSKLLKINR